MSNFREVVKNDINIILECKGINFDVYTLVEYDITNKEYTEYKIYNENEKLILEVNLYETIDPKCLTVVVVYKPSNNFDTLRVEENNIKYDINQLIELINEWV